MDLQLAGKVAVVTGASKGIGFAITRALVDEGTHVVAGARSSSPDLDALAADGPVTVVEVDLASPNGPAALVEAAGPRLDVLVNNVGIAPTRLDGFLEITDDMWAATINLDLMAGVRAMRAAIPVMLQSGGGAIVNVGSVNARLPDPAVLDYSAAKAAFVNAAKSVSKEFGGRDIRVNTIDPGPVSTDLWLGAGGVAASVSEATGQNAADVAAAAAAATATGRFTRPDEVAALCVILASERLANITGSDFVIDGGLIQTL